MGPVIAGAQTSASVNLDFFGGSTTSSFGYTSLGGYVRMRDSEIDLAWNRSRVQLGYFGPLISPLSPTSFATVAQPALAASGNLWIWSPQVSFEQDLPLRTQRGLSLEAGLISPPSPAYNSTQLDSPVEASRRPGAEGRIAFHSDSNRRLRLTLSSSVWEFIPPVSSTTAPPISIRGQFPVTGGCPCQKGSI